MSVNSIRRRMDYHHLVPQCLYEHFTDRQHRELEHFQILIDRDIHELIEATNKPLIYLIENGFPSTDEDFKIFKSYVSKSISNHTDRFLDQELVEIECVCGYKTPINPRSHKTKYCRNCGVQIYNVHNSSNPTDKH